MSDPTKELEILERFQTLIRAHVSFSDDQVLIMPGPGQGNTDIPGVWIYPGETERTSETSRKIRFSFEVITMVIISDEDRDLARTLLTTAAKVVKQIAAERDNQLGLSYVHDVEPLGAGVPMTEDPGLLASAARSINWLVTYQTTHAELSS